MKATASQSKPPAVVLLSGGLDSYTAAAIAKSDGYALYALTIQYGQRHVHEIKAARTVAKALGVVRHLELDVPLAIFGNSSLTTDIPVPKGRTITHGKIPSTYVPARNTVFLSLALAWAEVLSSSDIVIGVNALDYSGYPDCRPEYVAAFQTMANLATKRGVEGQPIEVRAPLIGMSKKDIIEIGLRLGLDYGATVSCYRADSRGLACGTCDACGLRKDGFEAAGVADPTRYFDE